MGKINLVKKEEIPKLILGGVTIFSISWLIVYLVGVFLQGLINLFFGKPENYTKALSEGLADFSAVYQLGFLTGVIILVALLLLIILVAYDEYYFSREAKGFPAKIFWGSSWALIFLFLDSIVGSVCFLGTAISGCQTLSLLDLMGVFYWLFILFIILLPLASEYYGRAKASYKN